MVRQPRLTRRAALRAGLSAATAGVAGCGGVGAGRDGSATRTASARPTTLTPPIPTASDRWPGFQFDERNTGHATDNEGRTGLVAPRWRATADNSVAASPVIADGVVFAASTDTNLYAFRWDSGGPLDRFRTGDFITATPAVVDGTIYLGSRDGTVYALPAGAFRGPEPVIER